MFDVNILGEAHTLCGYHLQAMPAVSHAKSHELFDLLSMTYSLLFEYNDSFKNSPEEKTRSVLSELEQSLAVLNDYIYDGKNTETEEKKKNLMDFSCSLANKVSSIKNNKIEPQPTPLSATPEEQNLLTIISSDTDLTAKLKNLHSHQYLDRYVQSKTSNGKEIPAAISLQAAILNLRAVHGMNPVSFKDIEIFEMDQEQLPEFQIMTMLYEDTVVRILSNQRSEDQVRDSLNKIVRPKDKESIFFVVFGFVAKKPSYGVLIFNKSGDCQVIRNDKIMQVTTNGGNKLTAEAYTELYNTGKGSCAMSVYPSMDINILTDVTKKLLSKYSKSPQIFEQKENVVCFELLSNLKFSDIDHSILANNYVTEMLLSYEKQ